MRTIGRETFDGTEQLQLRGSLKVRIILLTCDTSVHTYHYKTRPQRPVLETLVRNAQILGLALWRRHLLRI